MSAAGGLPSCQVGLARHPLPAQRPPSLRRPTLTPTAAPLPDLPLSPLGSSWAAGKAAGPWRALHAQRPGSFPCPRSLAARLPCGSGAGPPNCRQTRGAKQLIRAKPSRCPGPVEHLRHKTWRLHKKPLYHNSSFHTHTGGDGVWKGGSHLIRSALGIFSCLTIALRIQREEEPRGSAPAPSKPGGGERSSRLTVQPHPRGAKGPGGGGRG